MDNQYNAICVLHPNKDNITGIIKFSQKKGKKTKVEYLINGLKDGLHGFHVHEYGDLTDGCKSTCSHYNPTNKSHGGRNSKERHVGDLGNISSLNNISKGHFYDSEISLDIKSIKCIIGRAIVIHAGKDDLGRGKNEESKKTGNAGSRVACGIIGFSKKKIKAGCK
jgi:superoxide dismutase, Cu-Zn family